MAKFESKNTYLLKKDEVVFEDVVHNGKVIIEKGMLLTEAVIDKIKQLDIREIKVKKTHLVSRKVNINYVRPGMTVTGPVNDKNGNVIYPPHVNKVITEKELKLLLSRGVTSINLVKTPLSEMIFKKLKQAEYQEEKNIIEKLTSSQTEILNIKEVERFETEVVKRQDKLKDSIELEDMLNKQSMDPNTSPGDRAKTVTKVLDQFKEDKDIVILIDFLRDTDYTNLLSHSKTIMDYAVIIGKFLGYSLNRQTELAYAAFLCDFGMMEVNSKFVELTKSKAFSKDVMLHHVRKHPILSAKNALKSGLPPIVIKAIEQHHERPDGSGYPYGEISERICEYAKIISVVDSYDSMTGIRVYKKTRKSPIVAIRELIDDAGKNKYDKKIVRAFYKIMGLYPISTIVELTNGEIGMVTKSNEKISFLPTIDVFMNKERQILRDLKTVDLAERKIPIKREVKMEELEVDRKFLENLLLFRK